MRSLTAALGKKTFQKRRSVGKASTICFFVCYVTTMLEERRRVVADGENCKSYDGKQTHMFRKENVRRTTTEERLEEKRMSDKG